jgi:hypothetical protein
MNVDLLGGAWPKILTIAYIQTVIRMERSRNLDGPTEVTVKHGFFAALKFRNQAFKGFFADANFRDRS